MGSFEIVTGTAASVVSQRARHTEFASARTIIEGSNWNKIRIGAMFSTSRATAWTGASIFYFGLTSGKTLLPGKVGAKHFLGRSSEGNWTVTGNYIGVPTKVLHKIVNGVSSSSGNWGASPFMGRNDLTMGAWIIDITKGSPNFTVAGFMRESVNITQAMFHDALAFPGNPSGWTGHSSQMTSIDEATNGYFDTMCFSWGGTTETIELDAFDYRVMS